MKQWHLEHIEKTIKKFITGLSETASIWEKRQHKRYGTIANCCKQIDYDLKHGVTIDEALEVLKKIKSDSTFSHVLENENAVQRLNEIEKYVHSLKNSGPN
jgi:ASC-1-like (ASCH) protein